MSLVHNERVKLVATALNNTAVATVATAFLAPAVGFLYGTPGAASNPSWLLIGAAWLVVGVGLELLALVVLGRLKP